MAADRESSKDLEKTRREQRRGAALRENLRRRKAQARAREQGDSEKPLQQPAPRQGR